MLKEYFESLVDEENGSQFNQQSDHNTKGLTKKLNEIKNTTKHRFTIRSLLSSVKSGRIQNFNFKQQDTVYHTPLNYFKIEGLKLRINLTENLSNEPEPSVRLKFGGCIIREDSTVNLLNSTEDLYNNRSPFQLMAR